MKTEKQKSKSSKDHATIGTKVKNTIIWGLNINETGSVAIPSGFSLSTGTEPGTRTGRKVKARKLVINGVIYSTPGTKDNFLVRSSILVLSGIRNKQSQSFDDYLKLPSLSNTLNIHWLPNKQSIPKITYLKDELFALNANHSFDVEIEGNTVTLSAGKSIPFFYEIDLKGQILSYTDTHWPQDIDLVWWLFTNQNPVPLSGQFIACSANVNFYYDDII